ncbi:MAG TPA: hypothetical protein VJV23_17030 [Candidatus Polarisedimenticolia bacterium]|nr:hypothetical protein [Candidatus Polarisedimenticolia bacterium]
MDGPDRRPAARAVREFGARLDALCGPDRGGTQALPEPAVFLHADRERKAAATGDPRPSHFDPAAWTVHLAPEPGREPDMLGPARAAVDRRLGPPEDGEDETPREALALLLAGRMLGKDLAWWAETLGRAGPGPPAGAAPADAPTVPRSYLVELPATAWWLGTLAGRGELPGCAPAELAAAERASRGRPLVPGPTPPPRTEGPLRRAPGGFQKGMALAHQGYAVVDGYGSSASRDQLSRLAAMGASWVALTPYAYMADPSEPAIRFHRSPRQRAGAENDHAVLADARHARGLGLRVMLKPQIWLRPPRWTGDVAMRSEHDWARFFEQYADFLAHHALLAAAADADLLVIGVELQGASGREPEWRRLAAMARSLYQGPITYAANWGEEFESLSWWDALDYAGLDFYYPLSDDPAATGEDLDRGAAAAAVRAERVALRWGRQVVLTEAGFPALAACWVSPHDERTGAGPDEQAQARAYLALLRAVWERPWAAGIHWWKWPTTPLAEDRPPPPGEPLFSPRGRAAQRVLEAWYGGLGEAEGKAIGRVDAPTGPVQSPQKP